MNYRKFFGAASAALLIVIMVTLALVPGACAQSTYKTLHKFMTAGADGKLPLAGLIFDAAGNLYGTTYVGGNHGYGAVFKLAPNANGSWTESVLHNFTVGADGGFPLVGLILDQAGNLYGTARYGGGGPSSCYSWACGVVFKLTPNAEGGWTESVLYSFCSLTNCTDGAEPEAGLIFDQAGNLYGTTTYGGNSGCNGHTCGLVFKLTPNAEGGWTESVLYSFCSLTNCSDGALPAAGLIFDAAGNLYGTTEYGGAGGLFGGGTVFELTPQTGGGWTETVLHSFCADCSDGQYPAAGVIFDAAGNLYGTTEYGGATSAGIVFKLTANQDGTWREDVLHTFTGGKDGNEPQAGLIFDAAGNLYGTTQFGGGGGEGVVFKLTANSNGGWHEKVLHAFLDRPGGWPNAGVIFDTAGNLYGTASDYFVGGCYGACGSVFEITP